MTILYVDDQINDDEKNTYNKLIEFHETIFGADMKSLKAQNMEVAQRRLDSDGQSIDIAFIDRCMNKSNNNDDQGIILGRKISEDYPHIFLILMTGLPDSAQIAMNSGGFSLYITKRKSKHSSRENSQYSEIEISRKITDNHIFKLKQKLKEQQKTIREGESQIKNLVEKVSALENLIGKVPISDNDKKQSFRKLIGETPEMKTIKTFVSLYGKNDDNILILGDNGTGKEEVANAIHNQSKRKNSNFVPVNCAAIPEALFESELFGYEKGAFTGAEITKKGLIEDANKGTLFLDEIGDLPLPAQAKLLRIIQEKKFYRVGGRVLIPVDFRLICATNRNLQEEIVAKRFRIDLYNRIRGLFPKLPKLSERKNDIQLLLNDLTMKLIFGEEMLKTNKFPTINNSNNEELAPSKIQNTYHVLKEHEKYLFFITQDSLNVLIDHKWDGNVRELLRFYSAVVKLIFPLQLAPIDKSIMLDCLKVWQGDKEGGKEFSQLSEINIIMPPKESTKERYEKLKSNTANLQGHDYTYNDIESTWKILEKIFQDDSFFNQGKSKRTINEVLVRIQQDEEGKKVFEGKENPSNTFKDRVSRPDFLCVALHRNYNKQNHILNWLFKHHKRSIEKGIENYSDFDEIVKKFDKESGHFVF